MTTKITGLTVRELRKIAAANKVDAYQQGGQWMISTPSGEVVPQHYSIKSEREALGRWLQRGRLVHVTAMQDGSIEIVRA